MGKAKRKPKPDIPGWEWLNRDGCWFCKKKNNCSSCGVNRRFLKENIPKKNKNHPINITSE